MRTGALGYFSFDDFTPVQVETIYDLASLTKVVATTEVVRHLCRSGAIRPEDAVKDLLPDFAHEEVTLDHLLRHTSGLPAYVDASGFVTTRERVLTQPLSTPVGEECVYSCVGFVVLQMVLEEITGQTLDRLFDDHVAPTYGFEDTRFRPTHSKVPPTTSRPHGQGVVHDPLAAVQGGVSGNAGLFGNATDLGRFAQALLSEGDIEEWNRRRLGEQRGRGWDFKSPTGSSCGSLMSPGSFGHTGFTGTSIWIDHEADFFAVLLTNAIYPSGERVDLQRIRAEFADLAYESVR